MKNKIVWRLKEAPTPENLRQLVQDGILSKEEAREILFSSETEDERDKKSLESEITFLRELVEKLAKRSDTITTIKTIEVPYRKWDWYRPYITWCDNPVFSAASTNAYLGNTDGGATTYNTSNFSSIKTF